MKIRLALLFFMMFFVSCVCVAGNSIIKKVEVEGLHNVKSRKVLSVIELKRGKSYSVDAAREDVSAITALEYFDDVEVRYDESRRALIFAVTEKPYIEHIIFKGISEFSASKLKSTSLLKEKNYYDLL
jgi:outer membrane protein assembly factor BamA